MVEGVPPADELSTAMQKGVKTNDRTVKLTKDQADCAAKIFVKSDLSDEALQAIADGDETYKESKKDAAALKKITRRPRGVCDQGLGGGRPAVEFPRYLGFLAASRGVHAAGSARRDWEVGRA